MRYLKFTLVFFLSFCFSILGVSQKQIYRFENKSISKKELLKNAKTIKKRVAFYSNRRVKLTFPSDTSYIEISGRKLPKMDKELELLFSVGKFQILPNYNSKDSLKSISDKWYGILRQKASYTPFYLWYCYDNKVIVVDSIIKSNQKLLPNNVL